MSDTTAKPTRANRSHQTHRVKTFEDGMHINARQRVRRTTYPEATWDKLVDHYRKFPGDHAGAAKAANATYNGARRAWDIGSPRNGREPIKVIVAQESAILRGELAELRRLTVADRQTKAKVATDDLQDDKVLSARVLRSARGNAAAMMALSGQMLRTAIKLSNELANDLDEADDLTPKDKLYFIRSIIRMNQQAVESAGITARMEHDTLGGPDVVVNVTQVTEDNAVAILEQSVRTLRRLEESRLEGRPIIDSTAADPTPLALLPSHDPLRFPTATARLLDLPDSKNIAEARHDEQSNTLWVTFTSGGQYRYLDVEPDIVEQWENAKSAGEFFANSIKTEYENDRVG